jgi:hypothetical protein
MSVCQLLKMVVSGDIQGFDATLKALRAESFSSLHPKSVFIYIFLTFISEIYPTMNVCRAIRFYMRFVKKVRSTQWLLY